VITLVTVLPYSKEMEYTELQQHMREQLGEKDSKLTDSAQQAQQQIDRLQAKLDQVIMICPDDGIMLCHIRCHKEKQS